MQFGESRSAERQPLPSFSQAGRQAGRHSPPPSSVKQSHSRKTHCKEGTGSSGAKDGQAVCSSQAAQGMDWRGKTAYVTSSQAVNKPKSNTCVRLYVLLSQTQTLSQHLQNTLCLFKTVWLNRTRLAWGRARQ